MNRRVLGGAAAVVLVACASGGARPAPQRAEAVVTAPPAASSAAARPRVDKPPFDPEPLLARELNPLPVTEAVLGDLELSVSTEAASAPIWTAADSVSQLEIPIGTRAPVKCFVRRDSPDIANLIRETVSAVTAKVEKSEIMNLDAGAVGKHPYLQIELKYIVDEDGEKSLGSLKMSAFVLPDAVLMCAHDELGYRATFRRVTSRIAQSLRVKSPMSVEPIETLISVMRKDGQPIGFCRIQTFKSPDGRTVDVDAASTLFVRLPSGIESDDSAETQTAGKDGVVTEIRSASSSSGEIVEDVRLTKLPSGKFHVEALTGGKRVSGDFAGSIPILANWRARKEKLKLLAPGGPKELGLAGYSASDDPLGLTIRVVTPTGAPGTIEVRVGARSHTVVLDSRGAPRLMRLKATAAELVIERVVDEHP